MLFARHRSQFLPVAGLVFSVIGFIYSLVMSLGVGADALCITSGCAVVQDFRVFGISPWWASAFMFALLGALCFLRMRLAARLVAAAFLAGDCVFLILMFFVAPCVTCLIGGFIIFCAWLALRHDRAHFAAARRVMSGALSLIWLALFLLNAGFALNEALPSWELGGDDAADKKISVFFSPSCPACREAVNIFSGRAAFYPVAENERDYGLIADMEARMAGGMSLRDALEAVLAEQEAGGYKAPAMTLLQSMGNKIKIMRNQAAVLRHGYGSLPVLVFEGLPAAWAGQRPPAVEAEPEAEPEAEAEPPAQNAAPSEAEPQPEPKPDDPGAPDAAPASEAKSGPDAQPNSEPAQNFGSPDLPPELSPDFGQTIECGRSGEKPCDEPQNAPQPEPGATN